LRKHYPHFHKQGFRQSFHSKRCLQKIFVFDIDTKFFRKHRKHDHYKKIAEMCRLWFKGASHILINDIEWGKVKFQPPTGGYVTIRHTQFPLRSGQAPVYAVSSHCTWPQNFTTKLYAFLKCFAQRIFSKRHILNYCPTNNIYQLPCCPFEISYQIRLSLFDVQAGKTNFA